MTEQKTVTVVKKGVAKTYVDGRVVLVADHVRAIQAQLALSDRHLAELLGLSPRGGPDRVRKWKDAIEEASGPSSKMLLLWSKLDPIIKKLAAAERQIDAGEWDAGHELLRQANEGLISAIPDFMSPK